MDKYTIRPIINLINQPDKKYIKAGDLAQIKSKVMRAGDSKNPVGSATAPLEREYINIINEIEQHFTKDKKLLKTQLIEIVDNYIKKTIYSITAVVMRSPMKIHFIRIYRRKMRMTWLFLIQ